MKHFLCCFAALLLCLAPLCARAEDDVLLLSMIGDCSIGESYQYRGQKGTYSKVVEEKGTDWPFASIGHYLLEDDLTIANLEVVFTSRTKHQNKNMKLIGDPKNVQVLVSGGVDVVNTANNHVFDFYKSGYLDTVETLEGAGIGHFGSVYPNNKSSGFDVLCVREVKGVRIGMLGFSYPQQSDLKLIYERIDTLRNEENCDLVIVSLHWGKEVKASPQSWQYEYARKIIDAGADVIYGHHPHVLQQVHVYNGKPILYSTGNFTFGSIKSSIDTDTGIFQLRYDLSGDTPTLAGLTVIPCRTQIDGNKQPYELTDEAQRETMLRKLLFKKTTTGMENLPEGFAKTGCVYFDENGAMRAEE